MTITASRGSKKNDSNPKPLTFDNFSSFVNFITSDLALEKGRQYITGLCNVAPDDARHNNEFASSIGKPHRCKDCVSDRSWLGLDIDGCMSPISFNLLREILASYSALLYTTASHTEGAPRCRVIIELNQAVNREVFRQVSQYVRAQIDSRMQGAQVKWDPACDRPEQPLYLPLVTSKSWRFSGAAVNVAGIPLKISANSDLSAESVPFSGSEDPVAVMEWIKHIDRVKRARPGQRNSVLNSSSHFLGQLIAAGRLRHDTVLESLTNAVIEWGEPEKQIKKIVAGISSGRREPSFMDPVSEAIWRSGNQQIQSLPAYGSLDKGPTLESAEAVTSAMNLTNSLSPLSQLSPLSSLNSLASIQAGYVGSEVLLKRGDEIIPEPIMWLWNGWLAEGKMHIIGGAPGCGKTTIACKLAATVTAGGIWPDGTRAPVGNVVIWSGEDDIENVLVPRMIASGADMKRVHFVVGMRENGLNVSFDPSKDLSKLKEALSHLSDVRLLIIDPIVSMVSGDSHKNAEVRRSLQPLVDLTADLDCALIGITHFTKGTQGRDPLERITGSLAFGALARVVMVASVDESGDPANPERLLVRAKSNLGPSTGGFSYHLSYEPLAGFADITGSTVVWGGELVGTAREILGQAESHADDNQAGCLDMCKSWLEKFLADRGFLVEEVTRAAAQAGYSPATLKRAKKALGIKSKRFHDKWVWLPPASLIQQEGQEGQDAQAAQEGQPTKTNLPMPPPSLEDYWRKQALPALPEPNAIDHALRLPPRLI